jgi:hypothetical protein
MGDGGMWDEEDGYYYDVLRLTDGSAKRLKVRSMVGLLPLCATTVTEQWPLVRAKMALVHLRAACPDESRKEASANQLAVLAPLVRPKLSRDSKTGK